MKERLYLFGQCPACGIGLALDTSKPYRELGVWCHCGAISALLDVLRRRPLADQHQRWLWEEP